MHDITKTRDGYEVFTSKEKPWHGLGTFVTEAQTSEAAIKLAKLDWEVHQSPVMYKTPSSLETVPASRVNWRWKDDHPITLGVVSNSYGVVQNWEAFEFFDDIIGSKDAIFETAGSLRDGRIVFITAKFPDFISVQGDDSLTEMYCVLSMGHDGKTAIQVMFTPIRVVCNNTLLFAQRRSKLKLSIAHTKNAADRLQQAAQIMGIKNQLVSEFSDLAKFMQQVRVDDLRARRSAYWVLYGKVSHDPNNVVTPAQDKRIDRFMEYYAGDDSQKGITGTAWGLSNALAAFAQHEVAQTSRIEGRAMETIIKQGSKWQRIQDVVNQLVV